MANDELKRRVEQRLTYQDYDNNNRRLVYNAGIWAAGPYRGEMQVRHNGGLWRCAAPAGTTTTLEPTEENIAAWFPLTPTPGIGGMVMAATPTAGPDWGAGWTTIDQFDTADPFLYGATMTPASGQFSISFPGTWDAALYAAIGHNEINAGRESSIRLFNVTNGAPVGPGVLFGVGRNQSVTNLSIPFRSFIGQADLGDQIRLEIGNGDAFTNIVWEALNLDFLQVHALHG